MMAAVAHKTGLTVLVSVFLLLGVLSARESTAEEAEHVAATTTSSELKKSAPVDGEGGKEDDLESCPGYNVQPVQNRIKYTGPDQLNVREGKGHFRCFQGQHYEDLYMIQNYFSNVGGGFFVELGALDGFSYSVTYFFEQFMKWDGLLVEASPKNELKFKQKMRKLKPGRRRHVPFLLAAACKEEGGKPLNYVAKEGTGAGIFEFMPKSEQDRVLKEGCPKMAAADWYAQDGNKTEMHRTSCAMIPVRCIHLGDEMARRGVSHVDLFVLDVQGAELGVIQTLHLQKIPVHFFWIELDGTMPQKDMAVRCVLRRNGFVPVGRLDLNELWENTNFDRSKYSYTEAGKGWHKCFKGDIQPHLQHLLKTPPGGGGTGGGGGTDNAKLTEPKLDDDFTSAPMGKDQQGDVNAVDKKGTANVVAPTPPKVPELDGDEDDSSDALWAVMVMVVIMIVFVFRVWRRSSNSGPNFGRR